jgi:hypothetical protein
MLALIIKISAIIFFTYIAIDSFIKVKKIAVDVNDDLINPTTARVLRRKALRNGILYALLAIASIVALFYKLAPLGE